MTINAAHAIGRADTVGSLKPASRRTRYFQGDNLAYLPYQFGINHVHAVFKRGTWSCLQAIDDIPAISEPGEGRLAAARSPQGREERRRSGRGKAGVAVLARAGRRSSLPARRPHLP